MAQPHPKVNSGQQVASQQQDPPLLVEIAALEARIAALYAAAWTSTFGGSYTWQRALNDLTYIYEAADRLAGLVEQLNMLTSVGREEVQR